MPFLFKVESGDLSAEGLPMVAYPGVSGVYSSIQVPSCEEEKGIFLKFTCLYSDCHEIIINKINNNFCLV